MITVKVDISRMLAKLGKVHKFTNQSMAELVDQQAKLFIADKKTGMIGLLPPNSEGVHGGEAKKQGERAVARDINRVYASAGEMYLAIHGINPAAAAGFYSAIKNGDDVEANRIIQSVGGRWRNVRVGSFDESLHEKYRRKGKVNRQVPAQVLANVKQLEAYIKKKIKNVGLMASGWNDAAKKIGARIPAWVKRHGGKNSSAQVKITKVGKEIRMQSRTGIDSARIADRARYAIKYRINAMKRRLPYLIRAAAKKATK